MRKFLILATLLALGGCTYETEYGRCVGAFEAQKPGLVYKPSINNLFWGIVGFELIYPPIKVAVDATFCPIDRLPEVVK